MDPDGGCRGRRAVTRGRSAGTRVKTPFGEITIEEFTPQERAGEPRVIERAPVLSNSFGFGGHNATLVLVPHS